MNFPHKILQIKHVNKAFIQKRKKIKQIKIPFKKMNKRKLKKNFLTDRI